MDEKNDSRWLNEILRIEKEKPFAQNLRKLGRRRNLQYIRSVA